MKNKVILISDIHVYKHKGMSHRQDDCLKCLEWAFKVAKDREINDIIFAGDLFHDKQKIHTTAYSKVFEVFESNPKINFYLLVGNHDMWFSDDRSITTVYPFNALNNVKVIKDPSTLEICGHCIDFMPYTKDPIGMMHSFAKKNKILIGHLAVNGAILNFTKNIKAEVEIETDTDMIKVDQKFFTSWEKVFLGHYHGSQILNNFIEYIGSPLQLSWNETDQQKHIIVLDLDDFSKEYIINDFSPKHETIKIDEIGIKNINNDFVRILIDSLDKTDVLDVKSFILDKYNPIEISFIESKKNVIEEFEKDFDTVSGDLLERYVETIGVGDLDKIKILEIGKGILSGEI